MFDGSPKMSPQIWASHLEDYFEAISMETGQIPFAGLHLTGNAKIWWRRAKFIGVLPEDWSIFVNMLIAQFSPIDGNRKAREQLNHLRQTSSVQDYIGKFTNLMYEINDMGQPDAFHKFMDGLKPHIQIEMKKREITSNLGVLQTQALRFDELTFSLRSSEHSGFKKFHERKPFDKTHHDKKPAPSKGFHLMEKKDITCFNCGIKGHIAKDCRKPKKPRTDGKKPWVKKKTEGPKDTGALNLMTETGGFHSMQLKVQKLSKDTPIPVRKTPGSAGMDIGPGEDGVIEAGETKRIRTGIALEIPPNHFIQVAERSSMRDKVYISGVIDPDFRHELLLIVTNHTTQELKYCKGGKAIAQLILIPYASPEVIEVKELSKTERKGGFGSTDGMMEVSIKPGKLNFKGTANGVKTNYLVDSGADGIFGGRNLPKELGMTPTKLARPMVVTAANNQDIEVTHQLENVPMVIQGYKSKVNIRLLHNDHEQVVLGNPWLHEENPHINWREKEATLMSEGNMVTIKVHPEAEEPKSRIDYLMVKNAEKEIFEEGDIICVISKADIEQELGIDQNFYDRDREEVKDPELDALLEEFSDVFRTELPEGKPAKHKVQHHIRLKPGAKPRNTYQYRIPEKYREQVKEVIEDLKKKNLIEPSTSPWRSPLLVVLKKDGKIRVVFDFRNPNEETEGQSYTMKWQDDMLMLVAGNVFMALLDLLHGFHQIPMAEDSKEITAFSVPGPNGGQYQWKVMPFGLKNAPATFQQFVDEVFQKILGVFAVVYIDDLAIFSNTQEQHLEHL